MKDRVVVQTRSKLTLSADHMTQPFYIVSDVIVTLTYYAPDIIIVLPN